MRKLFIIAVSLMVMASCATTKNVQTVSKSDVERIAKQKAYEYKKSGFVFDTSSSSLPLEYLIQRHVSASLNEGKALTYGVFSSYRKEDAVYYSSTMALAQYAKQCASNVRGRITIAKGSIAKEMLENIYEAYESNIREYDFHLTTPYTIVKKNKDGEYLAYTYFIVDVVPEDAAAINRKAMYDALKKNRVGIEFANEISEFLDAASEPVVVK